ncbi:conjugal transfer protein TrbL family protein [Bailinhaonella thermotolerans]|uniref:conjugal transfer protein TrbL family protein n=1 Tax=Bailinhaonella thermotolerans TaxID=1070861 RepID=UPI0011C3BB9E|nr:conjugal transfer protein TrbL family protein [Bailinhaonella thermotolerans]
MTPTPAPAPSPGSPGSSGSSGGVSVQPPLPHPRDCDMFDVGCRISRTWDLWLRDVTESAIRPTFDTLGDRLLSTPRVDELPRVVDLWTASAALANGCFVLLVMAGGLMLMGYETVQTSYSAKDVLPRLVLAFITANLSRDLAGRTIELTNALTAGLLGPGIDAGVAMGSLRDRLVHNVASGGLFLVLLVLAAVVLAVVLAVMFAARVTVTILLVVAAPLMLACHALPQTEAVARFWWRALAGVLAIQLCQALVFVTALRVLLTPDGSKLFADEASQSWDLLIVLCLLYLLIRIPAWISVQVWRGGQRHGPLRQVVRLVIFQQVMSAVRHMSSRRNRRGRP